MRILMVLAAVAALAGCAAAGAKITRRPDVPEQAPALTLPQLVTSAPAGARELAYIELTAPMVSACRRELSAAAQRLGATHVVVLRETEAVGGCHGMSYLLADDPQGNAP